MSLDHTMILGVGRTTVGNTTVLKVTQGGHTPVAMRQQVQLNINNLTGFARQMFVWNGNVYFPTGCVTANNNGWACFNPELGEFETHGYKLITAKMFPLFDRIGYMTPNEQGWGYSPEDKQGHSGDVNTYANDWAAIGDDIYMLNIAFARIDTWAYPFTSAPSGGPGLTAAVRRLAELGGEIYAVFVNSGGGTLDLYKLVAGTLVLQGTPTSHSNLTYYDNTITCSQVLFKFNNKLFYAVNSNTAAQPKMRLFEMNLATGGSTERSGWLPNEWGVDPTVYTNDRLFEVIDNIGTEKVFLVRCRNAAANWECYEFQEGAFISVDSGSEIIAPFAGVIWDPSCKAAQIKTAVDTVPSSSVEMGIDCFDLQGQGTADIDPRYRFNNAEPPPHPVCTGKAPYNVKTGLATVPSGISALADLSDDFSAGSVDEDLWQLYSMSFQAWNIPYDWGSDYQDQIVGHRVRQIGGALRFGKAGDSASAFNGMGVKSKWSMNGAFQVDFTLKDPENIGDPNATFNQTVKSIVGLIRLSPNEGFGFIVWRSSTGPQVKIRGMYMQIDAQITFSADFNAADGDVVRIERSGGNVWVVTKDPDGVGSGTQIITPGGGSNYSEAVYIVMGGHPGSTNNTWVETGTPDGDEPGFSDIDISGAGSLGLYYGGKRQRFDWDHITDLTPPKTGRAELLIDSET